MEARSLAKPCYLPAEIHRPLEKERNKETSSIIHADHDRAISITRESDGTEKVLIPIIGPPALLTDLQCFDPKSTVAHLTSLLTFPALHTNTLRIELLIHLACIYCRGEQISTAADLSRWLNDHLGNSLIVQLEDPSEDVFVSNVMSDLGNFRIFEGIWENNDFYLQETIDALFEGQSPPRSGNLRDSIFSLLRLSDVVAERLPLSRWTEGNGHHGHVDLPSNDQIATHRNTIVFTSHQLADLGLTSANLSEFIYDDATFSSLTNEFIGHSSLERHPLLKLQDGLFLVLPSAVSIAVRRYAVEWMSNQGLLQSFQLKLRRRQADSVFNEMLRRLGGTAIEISDRPRRPKELTFIDEVVLKFDTDKYAHAVLLHRDLGDSFQVAEDTPCLSRQLELALNKHLFKTARYLRRTFNTDLGITILITAGLNVGSAPALAIKHLPTEWHFAAFSIADFSLFTKSPEVSLLRLWKLEQQKHKLRERGLETRQLFGELNLFSYWREQGYCLIPRHVPYPGASGVTLSIAFLKPLRVKVRKDQDDHTVRLGETRHVRVNRVQPDPFFKEMERQPIYGVPHEARRGRLHGVVETSRGPWWLIMGQSADTHRGRELLGQLWEALLHWLNRLAPLLDSYAVPIQSDPILISISIEAIDEWGDLTALASLPHDHPTFSVQENERQLSVHIPKGFQNYFRQPKNIAERSLVQTLTSGVFSLLRKLGFEMPQDDQASEIVSSVITNDNARSIHMFAPLSPGDHMAALGVKSEPRFIQPEDHSFCRMGLASRIGQAPQEQSLRGRDVCLSFLGKAVDEIWQDIAQRLKAVNRLSVVMTALQSLETLNHDKEVWRKTALALVSIHQDSENIRSVARKRDTERASAAMASRVLVEMAICAAPSVGGTLISQSDFDTLLALIFELVVLANRSDAIRYHLSPDQVHFQPNGFIETDQATLIDLVEKFKSETFAEEFEAASRIYDSFYQERTAGPLNEIYSNELISAFFAEYGLSLDDYFEVVSELWSISLDRGEGVVSLTLQELQAFLKTKRGFTDEKISAVLRSFALHPRPQWEKVPQGFDKKDFYPWRFQRRLSLTMRPLVLISSGNEGRIVYGIQTVGESLWYTLDRIKNGWMRQESISSEDMKVLIGRVANEMGRAFERKVFHHLLELGWAFTRENIEMSYPWFCGHQVKSH